MTVIDYFLGIDQSLTEPGFALNNRAGEIVRAASPKIDGKLRGGARLDAIERHLQAFIGEDFHRVRGACIEGPSLNSVHREFDLGSAYGVCSMACYRYTGVEPLVVPPVSLKKFAGALNYQDKAAMLYAVKKRWGFATDDDNVADAVALAYFARAATTLTFLRRAEREAVYALTRPKPKRPQVRLTDPDNI